MSTNIIGFTDLELNFRIEGDGLNRKNKRVLS